MTVSFLGDLCRDVNIIHGEPHAMVGGGVLHNGMTARGLGAHAVVITRCSAGDEPEMTRMLRDAGVEVHAGAGSTTSIENLYPDHHPDHRISRLLSRCDPFTEADLQFVQGDVAHVNPLWAGAFPEDLLPWIRKKVRVLGADAQGFLRRAEEDGRLVLRDWEEKGRWRPLFDVCKADRTEARVMTGTEDPREGARALRAMGVREVLLTHREGVCVHDGESFHEAEFGPYPLSGRTGRGDTCSAAYLVARQRLAPGPATRYAARVTALKLQHPGPFGGQSPVFPPQLAEILNES